MNFNVESCQVKNINEVAEKDPVSLRIENKKKSLLRKIGYYKLYSNIRNNKDKKYLKEHKQNEEGSVLSAQSSNPNLKSGDIVKIRTKAEILKTLDTKHRLKGCYFMGDMWQYCGTKQRVLKPVDHFFDECKGIMRKTKNIYLLEGLQCSGNLGWKDRCDRMCYFFWRGEWLEKV